MLTTLLIAALAAIVSAVVTYLFLRANPNKRAKIDDVVDRAKDQF